MVGRLRARHRSRRRPLPPLPVELQLVRHAHVGLLEHHVAEWIRRRLPDRVAWSDIMRLVRLNLAVAMLTTMVVCLAPTRALAQTSGAPQDRTRENALALAFPGRFRIAAKCG